jgi:hypothetical protein
LILPIFFIFSLTALGMVKTRKQRGGGLSVLTAQIDAIQRKQNELSTSVANVDERALTEALEEVLKTQGRSKQIEADIRFYTESLLKDEKTVKDLFEQEESIPTEYVSLISVLGNYSKMRNDMDTLIKSIYRYINLRLGYPLKSGEEPDFSSYESRPYRRSETVNNGSSANLPPLVGQANTTLGISKSRIPELDKKSAIRTENNSENAQAPNGSSWWGRSRTRRLLRKKN